MTHIDKKFNTLLEHLIYVRNDSLNGLTTVELNDYNEFTDAEYVHNTTKIEGNTLSLNVVKKLLKEPSFRKCIWDVTERELDEVLNYEKVLHYRRSCVGDINLHFVKQAHKHIMKNILESPGEFRIHNNIRISGVDKLLTPADLIVEELQYIIDQYYKALDQGADPFEQSVLFHYEFENIHPFLDGNGRTGREILNYMLEVKGYPMMLFTGNRMQYLSLLQLGDAGRIEEMVNGFAEIMLQDYGMPWSL